MTGREVWPSLHNLIDIGIYPVVIYSGFGFYVLEYKISKWSGGKREGSNSSSMVGSRAET